MATREWMCSDHVPDFERDGACWTVDAEDAGEAAELWGEVLERPEPTQVVWVQPSDRSTPPQRFSLHADWDVTFTAYESSAPPPAAGGE